MLEHGGNLQQAAQQYGRPLADWLDVSTGINPQHYPVPALAPALFQRLPAAQDGLAEAACAYYGCQQALPTAGSQAALQTLPTLRQASRVAMPRTMYQEHAQAWQRAGHTLSLFDDLPSAAVLATCDVLLLCNPNNPTGRLFTAAQLLTWHQQLQARAGWLVVDEAFMDITPEYSVAAYSHLPGLWVLRSLGKFFGLAGLRVGFLLAEAHALSLMADTLGPWTLTGPSRLIAQQALLDTSWHQQMRTRLIQQAQQLQALLTRNNLAPQGGTALFQYVTHPNSQALHAELATLGVWTRYFANPAALRFGLPPPSEWPRLQAALLSCQAHR